MCTGANCNDTLQVNIPTAIPGADGASAYVYIASADSNTGTNFSYPQDETQPYIAVLNTTSPITTPTTGNFTGLWRKVNGTDGTNGTNGTSGADGVSSGLPYNFLNYALTGDPASGNLSLSGANASTTNTISISYTTLTSANIQALLTALNTSTSSVRGFVKLTKKGDESKFVVYSLNTATDTGVYFTLSVNYLSSSAASPFVAGDDLYIEFYLTGDKGDKGDPGPAGAFIIGTIGAGAQAYPATASVGSAYRFTGDGTISDSGLGTTNVKRFYKYDVLYCILDSTASDGTKWFIWHGFPRAFRPGSGTDAFCQNVAGSNTATETGAIAFNSGSNATGLNSLAGVGATASGAQSIGVGVGAIASGAQAVAISSYAEATEAAAVALNNRAKANAVASVAIGAGSIVTSGATGAFNASYGGTVGAAGRQGVGLSKEPSIEFPGETVIGHGNFDSGKLNQAATRLIPQAILTTNATPTIMTFMPGETSGIVIPQDSAWMIEGTIVAARIDTAPPAVAVASWTFRGLIKNIAGTAAIVDNFLYLDPATGTYITASTQFAQDAGMAAAALAISASTTNLVLTVTGIADKNIRWSGSLKVEQVGWF